MDQVVIPPENRDVPLLPELSLAEAIVIDGIRRYIADRRTRVDEFCNRHFGYPGTFRLHRHAVGLDMVRAPANIAAGLAMVGKKGVALGVDAAGFKETARWLEARDFFLKTDLAREIEWLVYTELLDLPFAEGERRHTQDALIAAILADPRIQAQFAMVLDRLGRRRDDTDFREKVAEAMTVYVGSRSAAGDITATLMSAAAGFATYQQVTPGITALSAVVAGSIAKSAAASGFLAGPLLGKLYASLFAASAPPFLYAGVFAGMLVPLAALTAFAGVVADPVQTRLGLHQRRLNRMLDVLERNLTDDKNAAFSVHDHYVARIADLIDWSYTLIRMAR